MRTRKGTLGFVVALSGVTSCGVQDHPHATAPVDTSCDFGCPTTTTTAGSGGAGPTAGTGSSVASGTGGSGTGTTGTTGPATGTGTGGTGTGTGTGAGGAGPGTMDASAPADATAPPPQDAASGTTIMIGNNVVAKENAIAFIHLGHSNMAGRATGPASLAAYMQRDIDPFAWMYHVGMPLQPALEPFTAGDNAGNQYGGPGTPLLKQAAALAPGKYFISLGFGKGSAYCTQFLPGALYYDSLIAAPKAIKGRVTFAAIVILLGITERHGTAADISGFSSCINQLVTAIRTDVGEPNLPLLINNYEQEATGALATTSAFAQQIIPQINKIPSVVSNSVLVDTSGLAMQDDHHFNFDGHKVYTARVLQTMKDKGWFRW